MALSEYELRVLHEIETDLRASSPHRLRSVWAALITHRYAVLAVVLAIAVIALLAVFATGAVAAPVAGVAGALAGYAVSASWRHARR